MEVGREKIKADQIQYDTVMTVQVLQMGKLGDEKGSFCRRYFY